MKSSKLTKNLQQLEKLLFFLTILFLPTQLGKHFWPDFSFIFSLRIDYLSPTVYFWDLLVLGLAGIWGLSRNEKSGVNHKFLFFLLFFLLTQAVSVLVAENPAGSLLRLMEYTIAGLFGFYLASSKFSEIKNLFVAGLILGVAFTCLLAITQFLTGNSLGFWLLGEREFSVTTPLIAKFNFYEQIFLRPYATFSHPNMLAGFLIITMPWVLYGLPAKFKDTGLMLGLLISSTVFITFSRPALVLMAAQSIFLLRRFWKLQLILGLAVSPLVIVRLSSIFTFDTLAVLRREELSAYAIKLFIENPLFGIGLNNFINVLAANQVLVGTSRVLQPAHNIFFLVMAETGMFGLLGILGLSGIAFWQNFRKTDVFSRILLGNLLVIIFLGLFDHYLLTLPQGQRLLFMILGLSYARRNI